MPLPEKIESEAILMLKEAKRFPKSGFRRSQNLIYQQKKAAILLLLQNLYLTVECLKLLIN